MKKNLLLGIILLYNTFHIYSQRDSVATINPQEYEKRRIKAEQRWDGTFKVMYEEWLIKLVKPHIVLYKYSNGNTNEFGYLNFGNGRGRIELSEIEYLSLHRYIK